MSKTRLTIQVRIKNLLRAEGRLSKGVIEEVIRRDCGSYGETTARRLRELCNAGEIVKSEVSGLTCYSIPPVGESAATREPVTHDGAAASAKPAAI